MERGILVYPHRVHLTDKGLHIPCFARTGDRAGPMCSKTLRKDLGAAQRSSSLCTADIFIFLSAQQVHQQKCHSLRRKMEGEPVVSKANSQICSRQAGNWLLHSSSPVPDSPNRSHGHHFRAPLVFPCPSSSRLITAGSQQRPYTGRV